MRYPRVGGRGQGLRCRKNPKPEKCLKMPQTPTRRLHALLAGFEQDLLIENQNHRQHAQLLHITLILAKAENRTCQNACERNGLRQIKR